MQIIIDFIQEKFEEKNIRLFFSCTSKYKNYKLKILDKEVLIDLLKKYCSENEEQQIKKDFMVFFAKYYYFYYEELMSKEVDFETHSSIEYMGESIAKYLKNHHNHYVEDYTTVLTDFSFFLESEQKYLKKV